MAEIYTKLETSFTTADTEGTVAIRFSGSELVVAFSNFRTPLQEVVFHDVRAFSWSGWDDVPAEADFDGVCQVAGSSFLAPWEGVSVSGAPFLHFKLGFNAAAMFLDVVATRMEQKNA